MTMPADAPAWLRDILTELGRAQVRSEERFATVESQLVALTAAQVRTSEQLAALAAAQRQTSEQLARHDAQFATLAAAQDRMTALLAQQGEHLARLDVLLARQDERLATLDATQERMTALLAQQGEHLARVDGLLAQQGEHLARVDGLLARQDERLATLDATQERMAVLLARHDDWLGQLTGWSWESRVRDRAHSYLADVVDRVQVLTLPERDRLLDPAVRDGRLTRDEARAVRRADFIAGAVDPEDGAPRLLVAEVSARVARRDVERAAERAALLNRLGTPALAVVVGQRIDRDAQTAADAAGVRLIQASG